MGAIIKTFLWGVAIIAGLGVGEVVAEEVKAQYKDYKGKNKEEPDVKITDEEKVDVKVND